MRYDFERCHLDTVNREVTLDGAARHLSPKAFELLRLLLEDRPRVVPKAELMQRLWPDSFVVEANLPVLIAEARAAIGDAGVGHIIKTHHRVGYGFAAAVRETRSHHDRPHSGPPGPG
jgi:DNA-binding winged helix-turn-helix (wHTH) protein